MNEQHRECSFAEDAGPYLLGGLDRAERERFEAHVSSCAACRSELEELRPLVPEFALAAPAQEPPRGLFDRILESVRTPSRPAPSGSGPAASTDVPWQRWKPDELGSELVNSFAAQGEWESTPVPGVEARRLLVDGRRERVSMLVRMAPGSSFPAHVHNGDEECFVIQGDLRVGDMTMRAGDYQFAPAGTRHPVQSTERGCLLLLASSTKDERF
jgi:anti-sigma factor ChrR (cupin superfamily)